MWLPKDERETLRKYHSHIHNIDESICFNNLSERVCNATRNLIERGLLLEIKEGGKEHNEYMITWLAGDSVSFKGFLSFSEEDEVRQNVVLKFTLNGLDLANKYDNWWSRSNLWYAEHIKNHWIWLILSFLGGVISALLINWLSIYLQRTPSAK
jgi:hypothetical protein